MEQGKGRAGWALLVFSPEEASGSWAQLAPEEGICPPGETDLALELVVTIVSNLLHDLEKTLSQLVPLKQ